MILGTHLIVIKLKGILITFERYKNKKKYYKNLSKKDILQRLGNK